MTLHLSDNWRFDVNETLTSEIAPIIAFGDRLAAAGWVIVRSSDGSSTSASTRNDATRWNANDSWEHWRDPAGNRDFTMQRGTTNRSWRWYVGQYGDPFSGGTATTVPTGALTRVQLVGTSGSYATSFLPFSFASYEYHVAAAQVGRGQTGDVYEFYFVIRAIASTSIYSTASLFALSTVANGDYGNVDYEPWVGISVLTSSSGLLGLSGQVEATAFQVANVSLHSSGSQLNPYTGQYDIQPAFISENTGGREIRKGLGTSFAFHPTATPAANDTINNATEGRSFIRLGNYFLPWPHGVTAGTGSDYNADPPYGTAGWPVLWAGGWPIADEPVVEARLELALPGNGPPAPATGVRNRVWDTAAGGWHVWITTNGADPTGTQYDGPGTFGVDTSNYSVI